MVAAVKRTMSNRGLQQADDDDDDNDQVYKLVKYFSYDFFIGFKTNSSIGIVSTQNSVNVFKMVTEFISIFQSLKEVLLQVSRVTLII